MGMREIIIRMKLVGYSKGDIHKKMGMKWGLINYFSTYIHIIIQKIVKCLSFLISYISAHNSFRSQYLSVVLLPAS